MTNREKYINNLSNEELANTLESGFYQISTKINISENYFDVRKYILEWLSQEAEEDIVNIPNIGKMPKTDKIKTTFDYEKPKTIQLTKKEYKEAKLRLRRFERQLQRLTDKYKELEMEHKVLMNNELQLDEELDKIKKFNLCTTKILESHNLNYTKEMTADEMFEELGYEKREPRFLAECRYHQKNCESDIIIQFIKGTFEYIKQSGLITEAEDKAIHKKIEELKNGK